MKKILLTLFVSCFLLISFIQSKAQDCEWRVADATFTATDPDGAGPATGIATFKFQIRSRGANIPNIDVLSIGFSYQSALLMPPTNPGCVIVANPANVFVEAPWSANGFQFGAFNHCNIFTQNVSGEVYDRRTAGALSGSPTTLLNTWMDVLTITMWTKGVSIPQGGYVITNSGSSSTDPKPKRFDTYSISDPDGNEYPAYTLTYETPLAITGAVPVSFSQASVSCLTNGASISWGTTSENNSNYFDILKSVDGGTTWVTVGRKNAAGNSTVNRNYQYLDIEAGNALYKIRLYDTDGHISETQVLRSTCETRNAITAIVYPVPARDQVTLAIKSAKMIKTTLQVIDAKGSLVQQLETTLNIGSNNIYINSSKFASGEYRIISTNKELFLNKKFIIAR